MEAGDRQPLSTCVPGRCPARELGTICEFLIALGSATVTTVFTLHHEKRRQMVSKTNHMGYTFNLENFGINLDPSPFSLLASCLLLGCSISSFAHRRHGRDQCQSLIFVFAILTATTIGFGLGTNANLIMLGLIPWALIFAMIFSVFIHWTVRRYSRDQKLPPLFFLENGGKSIMSHRL
ncbi:hypothetical protein EAF04_005096 [Stromatinia cepivora]|nr:hypothetical protein EAF04_005096 [Stromatinia cepivora]